MCGIAGVVASNSERFKPELKLATDAISHRGPDGEGFYFFKNCALGHRRLSIIDLSTGDQPMLSSDRIYGLVFNGEIYGYLDIKRELSDYQFATTSDTEVILALYKKYGVKMMGKLPGMFAFALWDENRQQLFCARDRFGEKPFYYAWGKGGEFIFASEIKAILATGLIEPVLNKSAVAHYLERLYVHPHQTIYQNIFTLPPAHSLTLVNGKIKIERYWRVPETNKISLSDAIEQFNYKLSSAVQKQLIADVPVAAFLSGGLDSSTIVAIASKFKNNLKTISFGFEGGLNELPFAKSVADQYGTDHVELTIKDFDVAKMFLKMNEIYDEPFADSSNIPTYLISKAAKKYSTVVLSGDAGDELFGGYVNWYKSLSYKNNLLSGAVDVISHFTNLRHWLYLARAVNYKLSAKSIAELHNRQNVYFTADEQKSLLGNDYTGVDKFSWQAENTLNDAMKIDAENYMPGDILVKTDRAAMANSLELRAPFLDVDFAEFCLSLPANLKVTAKEDKIVLRKAMEKVWPALIKKRAKQGFGAPIKQWLGLPAMAALKNQYLNDPNQSVFKFISFNNSRNAVKEGSYRTWILLVLALWAKTHAFSLK